MNKITISDIQNLKDRNITFATITAYDYISAKIENIVNNMEDASISLVDILVKHKITKKW